jgi:hypothetical protein
MPTSYFTRFFDRSFDWATTSGLRVLLIAVAMLVLLALLKRAWRNSAGCMRARFRSCPNQESVYVDAHRQGCCATGDPVRRQDDDPFRRGRGLEACVGGGRSW